MFPGIYEFTWDAGHIIFLGAFYAVLTIVLSTMAVASMRAVRASQSRHAEAARWHADFEDLPESARRCRHEIAGEVGSRRCERAFDCRGCADHSRFVAAAPPAPLAVHALASVAAGIEVPEDRLYHRGHTWVRPEDDGSLTVGLDGLGSRLIGSADELQLPAPGTRLVTNGPGWVARKKNALVRVLSPVDGEVVETGTPSRGWMLKVRPSDDGWNLTHLLTPSEARSWMLREMERLQFALASDGVGPTLADGGVPIDDLAGAIPEEQLDEVCGLMFLEP